MINTSPIIVIFLFLSLTVEHQFIFHDNLGYFVIIHKLFYDEIKRHKSITIM
jgi:hypothetical protein